MADVTEDRGDAGGGSDGEETIEERTMVHERPSDGEEGRPAAAEGEGVERGDEEKKGSGAIVKLLLLAAIILGGIALARFTPVGDFLSREGIDRGIEMVRGSVWAPAIFVLTYGVAMALALPGTVLTLAGGALFGFWWGLLFNSLGANLGANAAFLLGRWLGRDGIEKLAGDRLDKLDKATREYGFKSLLTLRLIPVVPFNALNFGSGLTAMSWKAYAAATVIGILPGTAVYTMFADALLEGSREASREAFIRMIVAGILLVFLSFLPTIVKKMNLKIGKGAAALLLGLSTAFGVGATPLVGQTPSGPASSEVTEARSLDLPSHDTFTEVLARHVRNHRVDYAALKEDRGDLDRYLEALGRTDPDALASASRNERLAFWINAYNACMLRLVIDHYPLTEQKPSLMGRLRNTVTNRPDNSVWQIPEVFEREHCRVAGGDRSQDEIEHEIIRSMGEPRIHFAVNCAAASCPVLDREAYVAERLDEQLDRQVEIFMEREGQFEIEDGNPPVLRLNKVLDWYGEDFGGPDGIKRFFLDYVEGREAEILRNPETRVEFFSYDWTLNDTNP